MNTCVMLTKASTHRVGDLEKVAELNELLKAKLRKDGLQVKGYEITRSQVPTTISTFWRRRIPKARQG
jgi:hypothetical protein